MIKVSHNDLSLLTPSRGTAETFSGKIEAFLKSKGHAIPDISAKDMAKIKDAALGYWRQNKHENLTETAWLYAYCAFLKIDLDLSFKR